MKLTNIQIALVTANVISRLMHGYSIEEQPKSMKNVMSKIGKFMRKRTRINRKEFLDAMKIEHEVWHKTTASLEADVPLYVVHSVIGIYSYYENNLSKHTHLSQKLMETFSAIHSGEQSSMLELEKNDNILVNLFVDNFSEYSGVYRKKALFNFNKIS